jgi:peroxiredoxin
MTAIVQRGRIPDVVLQRAGGGEINPSALAGHELVVIFCPADPAAAAREIETYRALAGEFQDHGVWLLGVLADGIEPIQPAAGEPRIALAHDSSGAAWPTFAPWLDDSKAGRAPGATFLFTHRGGFDRVWAGTGHAKEVLEEARRRN